MTHIAQSAIREGHTYWPREILKIINTMNIFNKLKIDKMYKFPGRQKLAKLTHEEEKSLNGFIRDKQIK